MSFKIIRLNTVKGFIQGLKFNDKDYFVGIHNKPILITHDD